MKLHEEFKLYETMWEATEIPSDDYYVITTTEGGRRYYIRNNIDFKNPPEDAYEWFTHDLDKAQVFSSRQMAGGYFVEHDLGGNVFAVDDKGRKVRYYDYVKTPYECWLIDTGVMKESRKITKAGEFKIYETMWDEKYPHGSDLINGEYEEIPNNYQIDTKPHGKWILAYNNGNGWVFYNRFNSFSDNLDKAVRYESRMDALYNKDKANKKYKEETDYRANFIAIKEDSKRLTEASGNSKKAYSAMMKVQKYIENALGWTIIDCQQDDEYSMMLYCDGDWDVDEIEALEDFAATAGVEISIVDSEKSSYDYRVYLSY